MAESPRQIPCFSRQGLGHAVTPNVLGGVVVVHRVFSMTVTHTYGTGVWGQQGLAGAAGPSPSLCFWDHPVLKRDVILWPGYWWRDAWVERHGGPGWRLLRWSHSKPATLWIRESEAPSLCPCTIQASCPSAGVCSYCIWLLWPEPWRWPVDCQALADLCTVGFY